jgi:hypothetical protein
MTEHRADTTHFHYGSFAEGQAEPDRFPADERVGSFGDGEAEPIAGHDPGRFSEGLEELDDADPEKHVEGRFSDEWPEHS